MGDPKTILVTGGSGLVGKAIQKVTQDEKRPDETWIFVGSKDANLWYSPFPSKPPLKTPLQRLSSHQTTLRETQTHPCDTLSCDGRGAVSQHVAQPGLLGTVVVSLQTLSNPTFLQKNNLEMNSNVLQVSHEAGVKKVVSCLSTCIFPDKTTYPIDETMVKDSRDEKLCLFCVCVDTQRPASSLQFRL